MNKDTKRFAIGATVAAAVGYITGILTAPKSGKETRQDVKNAAVKAKSQAEKELKKLHSEIIRQLDHAKVIANDLNTKGKAELDIIVAAATKAKEKVRQVLTSIHEGDVEDKDLQKAIKDVTDAMEHLKAFIEKHAAAK